VLVSIEGVDGCGKTTLSRGLKARGYTVTREPYIPLLGERAFQTRDPMIRELTYYLDRLYHLEEFILPRLRREETVITDRYKYSQIAYARARYRDHPVAEKVVEWNREARDPDLVILIDLPAEEAVQRKPAIREEALPFLKKGETPLAFLERVRREYLTLKEAEGGPPWVTLDGRQAAEEVLEAALAVLPE
jgi:dTMP kinase